MGYRPKAVPSELGSKHDSSSKAPMSCFFIRKKEESAEPAWWLAQHSGKDKAAHR